LAATYHRGFFQRDMLHIAAAFQVVAPRILNLLIRAGTPTPERYRVKVAFLISVCFPPPKCLRAAQIVPIT